VQIEEGEHEFLRANRIVESSWRIRVRIFAGNLYVNGKYNKIQGRTKEV